MLVRLTVCVGSTEGECFKGWNGGVPVQPQSWPWPHHPNPDSETSVLGPGFLMLKPAGAKCAAF